MENEQEWYDEMRKLYGNTQIVLGELLIPAINYLEFKFFEESEENKNGN